MVGKHTGVDDGADLRFSIALGNLLWQPISGQNRPTPPLFIALAFQNGLEYRSADGRVNISDDCYIWHKFGEVSSSKPES